MGSVAVPLYGEPSFVAAVVVQLLLLLLLFQITAKIHTQLQSKRRLLELVEEVKTKRSSCCMGVLGNRKYEK